MILITPNLQQDMNKVKQLLSIVLYQFTGEEIGKIRQKNITDKHCFNFLPEYTININGRIIDAKYYFQFTEDGSEKFYLFDIVHIDNLLSEEINGAGIEDALDINFESIFNEMKAYTYEDHGRMIPIETHLIFDIEYISSKNFETGQYELDDVVITFVKILNMNE